MEDSKTKKGDKNVNNSVNATKEDVNKEKNKSAALLEDIKEESTTEEEPIYQPFEEKNEEETKFYFLSLDVYIHNMFKDSSLWIRYFIECLFVCYLLLFPLYILAGLSGTIDINYKTLIEDATSKFDIIFKFNVFFSAVYTIFCVFYILGEKSLSYISKIIIHYESDNDEILWSIATTIYNERMYMRRAMGFGFAFYLANVMYGKYERVPFTFDINMEISKTIILWLFIWNGSLFITRLVLNTLTSDIKLNAYKRKIKELNYKSFIFKKITKISHASDEIKSESNSNVDENNDYEMEYDPGFFVKFKSLFTSTEQTKKLINNSFALLGKTYLSYEDVKEYFPDNHENVYKYLSNSSDPKKKKKIKLKYIREIALSLYQNRKNMKRTLKDRDKIFDLFIEIFTIIVSYANLILFLFLFKMDFTFFTTTLFSFLLSFTWIFGDSIKQIYTCFLFLLVIRPYDIGDYLVIENKYYTVFTMNLFTSALLSDSETLTYMSHITLFDKDIKNISRSQSISLIIKISIKEGSTTYSKALKLQDKFTNELKKKSNTYTECVLYSLESSSVTYKFFSNGPGDSKKDFENRRRKLIKNVESISKSIISTQNSYILLNNEI
ncbi:MSL10 [Hepatospora eriocheir]|uniref:MSL10 n=1 Tax=Hepatospora eriocheir TaxID=1081669 RepID=A0A1X0QID2_9MICR|nr:MSL10 [Hepatospora eriocheir]